MNELKEGDKAPGFTVKNQKNEDVSLSDFQGRKVILYFYPKDDTSGCTAEACNLKENQEILQKEGYVTLGVSADDVDSHKKFAEKFDLPFDLLADTEKDIVNKYGVWGEKNMYGKKYMGIMRHTFLIDENGNIERIIKKVKTAAHAGQILEGK